VLFSLRNVAGTAATKALITGAARDSRVPVFEFSEAWMVQRYVLSSEKHWPQPPPFCMQGQHGTASGVTTLGPCLASISACTYF
jgi:hypothetical protein